MVDFTSKMPKDVMRVSWQVFVDTLMPNKNEIYVGHATYIPSYVVTDYT